ncbi:MAG: zinc-ribbon domain-containing protein [Proteobacteria bacterium]|nr:zinc-ribbon domain-containing protein [Pseudomonadota bacterium]
MIIACEKCGTRFSLDEEAVQDKQVKIRCSECQHIFSVGPAPAGGLPPEALDEESLALSDQDGQEQEEEDLGLPDFPELEGLNEALAVADASDAGASGGFSDDELESDLFSLGGEAPKPKVAAPPPPPPPRKAAPKVPEPLVDMEDLGLPGLDDDDDLGFPEEAVAAADELDLGLPDLEEEAGDAIAAMDSGEELDLGDLGDLGEDDLAASAPETGDDLGLPDFELDEAEAQEDMEVSHAAPTEAKAEVDDLDLGDLGALEEEEPAAAAGDDMDLGLPDFELDEAEAQEDMEVSHKAPAAAKAESDDLDLGDLGGAETRQAEAAPVEDLDLDLPELSGLETEEAAGDMPEGELDLDLDMGLDFGDEEAVAAPPPSGGEDLIAIQEALAATGPDDGAQEMDLSPEASMKAGDDLGLGGDDLDLGELGGDDLGLGSLEPMEEEAADLGGDLGDELDLDLGELDAETTAPEPETEDSDLDKTQVMEDGFDSEEDELGLFDLEAAAPEDAGELDLGDLEGTPAEPSGDLDLDLDLGDLEAAPEPVAEATGEMDLGDLDMDLGDLGDLEPEPAAARSEDSDLDLGDLDISGRDELDLAAAAGPGEPEELDLDSMELGTDGQGGELEIDLDMGETLDAEPKPRAMAEDPGLDIDFDMDADLDMEGGEEAGSLDGGVTMEMDSAEAADAGSTMEYDYERTHAQEEIQEGEEDEAPFFVPPPTGRTSRPLFAMLLVILALGGAFGALTIMKFMGVDVPILGGGGTGAGLADSGARGLVIMDDVKGYILENHQGQTVIVVRGHVRNDYPDARSYLRIQAVLYEQSGNRVGIQMLYAGNQISDAQIRRLTEEEVKSALKNRKGIQDSNVDVAPNTLLPFTAVFYNPPETLEDYTVEAQGSVPAGNV